MTSDEELITAAKSFCDEPPYRARRRGEYGHKCEQSLLLGHSVHPVSYWHSADAVATVLDVHLVR